MKTILDYEGKEVKSMPNNVYKLDFYGDVFYLNGNDFVINDSGQMHFTEQFNTKINSGVS